MLISLCVGLGWDLHVMDVRGAFLLPKLPDAEKLYMRPPPDGKLSAGWIYLLCRCIYGLKQSGARWRENVNKTMKKNGFVPTKTDPAVYVRYLADGTLDCMMAVHVDDFLIGADDSVMAEVKALLNKAYVMSDDGRVSWFLKIKFTWSPDRRSVWLSQPEYVDEIVEAAGLGDGKEELLPGRPHETLRRAQEPITKEEKEVMEAVPFRKVLGMVSYESSTLRPDITYHVAEVQRCASDPRPPHWKALQNIVLYLKGTRDYGIMYTRDLEEAESSRGKTVTYSDSDHAACLDTRRSILGEVSMLNGGPTSWSSKQAKHNTRSTMESELSALDSAAKQALYHRKLGMELGIKGAEKGLVFEDNAACNNFANGSKLTGLLRHIDIKYHAVRGDVEDGRLDVQAVSTTENRADMFTKSLAAKDFLRCRAAIGIRLVPKF